MTMKLMRRTDRQTSESEAWDILNKCEYGVLSTVDADNQPYGVPLSYAVSEDKSCIYFHGAQTGHKLDNIGACGNACFTVVGNTKVLPEAFSTEYESVVVFGTATVVSEEEKTTALRALIKKYSADFQKEGEEYIARAAGVTAAFKLEILSLTGKHRQ